MLITSIQIKTLKNTGSKLKAIASITLDNLFAIHQIKVLENDGQLFLGMPSKKLPNGTFSDCAHPLTTEARCIMETLIFAAYREAKEKQLKYLNSSLRKKNMDIHFNELSYEHYEVSDIFKPLNTEYSEEYCDAV